MHNVLTKIDEALSFIGGILLLGALLFIPFCIYIVAR